MHGREGFWRIGKTPTGVWWFVSPDNRPEFLNLVDTVQPVIARSRYRRVRTFVSTDYDAHATEAMDRWAQASVSRVLNIGFKGVGAWSFAVAPQLQYPDDPGPEHLVLGAEQQRPALQPRVEQGCGGGGADAGGPLRDNRNLVGYYLDNEMDWEDETGSPANYFDNLHLDDPNRQEVLGVIRSDVAER